MACRHGVIDFAHARLRDVRWWRRANILINAMARDDDLEIIKAAYQFQLALIANSQLTEDSWKASTKKALDLFNEIINVVRPWGARSGEQRLSDEMTELRKLYKKVIMGDKTEEEWDKVIADEVEWLRTAQPDEQEADEDRIDRVARDQIVQEYERKRRHGG